VYARVTRWLPQALPDSVRSLEQLESFLGGLPIAKRNPFAFRLEGEVDSARIHVVNLAPGARVNGPEDVHRGQRDFTLKGQACRVLGFYSTRHQGIFTHHDSFLHAHLITADDALMGHLDALSFRKGGLRLFLAD
jgi:acetolactate decarboxylase